MNPRRQLGLLLSALIILGGCTAPWVSRGEPVASRSLPQNYTVARPPLLIHSDFPLPADNALWDELAARQARTGSSGWACRPAAETVHVYLFDGPERFHEFFRDRHPNFPDRRAFFVESDTELAVYAQGGERLADDLRHEMTHAYLHARGAQRALVARRGPGQVLRASRRPAWSERQYVRQIAAAMDQGGWHPNLARLEQLPPTADMSQEDYVEAWAWVHFLLDSQPACSDLLRRYLADLRAASQPGDRCAPRLDGVGGASGMGACWSTCGSWRQPDGRMPQPAAKNNLRTYVKRPLARLVNSLPARIIDFSRSSRAFGARLLRPRC